MGTLVDIASLLPQRVLTEGVDRYHCGLRLLYLHDGPSHARKRYYLRNTSAYALVPLHHPNLGFPEMYAMAHSRMHPREVLQVSTARHSWRVVVLHTFPLCLVFHIRSFGVVPQSGSSIELWRSQKVELDLQNEEAGRAVIRSI